MPMPQCQAPYMDPQSLHATQALMQQMQMMHVLQQYDPATLAAMASAAASTPAALPTNYPPHFAAPPVAAPASVISVSVVGMNFQYQLTEDDLQKVFSRYGKVLMIRVGGDGQAALISFEHQAHAQTAMNDLDGKVLNGLEGKLKINWAAPDAMGAHAPMAANPLAAMTAALAANSAATAAASSHAAACGGGWFGATGPAVSGLHTPYPAMPSPYPGAWGFPAADGSCPPAWSAAAPAAHSPQLQQPLLADPLAPYTAATAADSVMDDSRTQAASSTFAAPEYAGMADYGSSPAAVDPKSPPPHVKGVRKWTCRFLIGIEAEGRDKSFQVVRKIIGAKGANMKSIFGKTDAKLRLRGKGSGYFEGASQKESSEPLQLCVSCTSSDGYHTAVEMAKELLESVYQEYRGFCREQGRPEPELMASPQVVSSRGADSVPTPARNQTARSMAVLNTPASPNSPEGEDDDDDEDGADGDGNEDDAGRRSNRRGRRSRGGKARGSGAGSSPVDASKTTSADRGDPPPKAPTVKEIERYIDLRNEARRQCNFQEADRIRQELHELGVALMDEPGARGRGTEVTTWRYWRE